MVYLRLRGLEGSLRAQNGFSLPLGEGHLLRKGDGLRFESLLQLLALSRPSFERLILLP